MVSSVPGIHVTSVCAKAKSGERASCPRRGMPREFMQRWGTPGGNVYR